MIDFDDWLQARMANKQQAAELRRLALTESEVDPRGLLVIAQAIIAAHGSLDDLGLSAAETLALSNALSRHIKVEQLKPAA
ncbi:MAG TPA: hypothetical protein VEF04_22090 [Blastocatellia bacterium]|nr:hypothetical protein [Blastocatellia bacterium]